MSSVTQRIKEIKQPVGGYINPNVFKVRKIDDINRLYSMNYENIHASTIGLAVDYLTRFMNNTNKKEAFKISLMGASLINKSDIALDLLNNINGLDNISIINACKLVGFDVFYRTSINVYVPANKPNIPNNETIHNIRVMVNRSLNFIKQFGPIVLDGFTFEGAYTDTVHSGDGDFLTCDTLWDFKVSKNEITKDHTLQLLMYYIMGMKSIHHEFKTIKNLGIYNPRLNVVYLLEINRIPGRIINEVYFKVIGY